MELNEIIIMFKYRIQKVKQNENIKSKPIQNA